MTRPRTPRVRRLEREGGACHGWYVTPGRLSPVLSPSPTEVRIRSERTHGAACHRRAGLVTREEETTSEKARETGLGPDSGQVCVTTFVTTWCDMRACDTRSGERLSGVRGAG